eukprot:1162127-Pelagomonas_calceolata.AAC.2
MVTEGEEGPAAELALSWPWVEPRERKVAKRRLSERGGTGGSTFGAVSGVGIVVKEWVQMPSNRRSSRDVRCACALWVEDSKQSSGDMGQGPWPWSDQVGEGGGLSCACACACARLWCAAWLAPPGAVLRVGWLPGRLAASGLRLEADL